MVRPDARRQGVGRAMASDSFARAKSAGFRAMQFNLVIATNLNAIALWRAAGMEEIGRLKQAFALPSGELVDALVMYRLL